MTAKAVAPDKEEKALVAPSPEYVPVGGSAVYNQQHSLTEFGNEKYNVLTPTAYIQDLNGEYQLQITGVRIDSKNTDNDVYKINGKLALRQKALLNLMHAAGGQMVESVRTDKRDNPDICEFRVTIEVLASDGRKLPFIGTKAINLDHLETQERERLAKKKQKMTPEAIDKAVAKRRSEWAVNIAQLAETKALLRAIRKALAIQATYTPSELKKPFVVARVVRKPNGKGRNTMATFDRVVMENLETMPPEAAKYIALIRKALIAEVAPLQASVEDSSKDLYGDENWPGFGGEVPVKKIARPVPAAISALNGRRIEIYNGYLALKEDCEDKILFMWDADTSTYWTFADDVKRVQAVIRGTITVDLNSETEMLSMPKAKAGEWSKQLKKAGHEVVLSDKKDATGDGESTEIGVQS